MLSEKSVLQQKSLVRGKNVQSCSCLRLNLAEESPAGSCSSLLRTVPLSVTELLWEFDWAADRAPSIVLLPASLWLSLLLWPCSLRGRKTRGEKGSSERTSEGTYADGRTSSSSSFFCEIRSGPSFLPILSLQLSLPEAVSPSRRPLMLGRGGPEKVSRRGGGVQ